MSRVFLLSPASCGGERARLLFDDRARFELARRIRAPEGVPLGEVFAFLSALYFRGKLAYALAFARPPAGADGVLVITPTDGLVPAQEPIGIAALQRFATVDIDARDPRYAEPLLRDIRRRFGPHDREAIVNGEERTGPLHASPSLGPDGDIVLLGSVASGKYVDLLAPVLGDRLRFPPAFVGRGDMSRGGLLLRCVDEGRELDYGPVAGAVRHGPRPPRLQPRS